MKNAKRDKNAKDDKNGKPADCMSREALLKTLSPEEVAHVTGGETSVRLPDGDEFIDLMHLDSGVQRARAAKVPSANILPRTAVPEETWDNIMKHLRAPSAATKRVGW